MEADTLTLTDRVAERGDVIETEAVFELTPKAMAYLAQHLPAGGDARG